VKKYVTEKQSFHPHIEQFYIYIFLFLIFFIILYRANVPYILYNLVCHLKMFIKQIKYRFYNVSIYPQSTTITISTLMHVNFFFKCNYFVGVVVVYIITVTTIMLYSFSFLFQKRFCLSRKNYEL